MQGQLFRNHLFTLFGELLFASVNLVFGVLKDGLDRTVGALIGILAKIVDKLLQFGSSFYQGLPGNLRLFFLNQRLFRINCGTAHFGARVCL